MLEFKILGPLEVLRDGEALRLGGGRQRSLLALLLLNRNEVVSADRLIDEGWGEHPPATATKIIQLYVSQLRKSLGADVLLTRPPGYVLRVEAGAVDADRFERLLGEAKRLVADDHTEAASAQLREAFALWRGPPLSDFAYEQFARAEIARLDELRLAALEQRIDVDLALGRHADLVGELEMLVAQQPVREHIRGQQMLALYRCGRQAEALEAYQSVRRVLVHELGLEPGKSLQELEQAILRQDPSLAAPPRVEHARDTGLAAIVPPSLRRRGPALILVGALMLGAGISAAAIELTQRHPAVNVAENSVATIDPSGKVTASVAVGSGPIALASTDDGLWVANLDDQTVTHVDPKNGRAVRTISLGRSPAGIAAAAGGVWVAVGGDAVDEIDPQYDRLAGRHVLKSIGSPEFGEPPRPVLHAFGSLWVVHPEGYVQRIDPASWRVEATVDLGNGPSAIAAGAGSVWVTNSDDGTVTRIDSTTLLTTTIPVGHGPASISIGTNSAWVANAGDDEAARIDLTTNAVTATTPVGDNPTAILATPDAVWLANRDDGTVMRLDPVSGRLTTTARVGGAPTALASAGNRIWVAVSAAPASTATTGGVARLTLNHGIAPLDPALAGMDPYTLPVLYATCANLVTYPDKPGPQGSQPVPEIAQALPVPGDGGTTYKFAIRPGFRFSPPSNAPVTAAALKATIDRITNPRMRSPAASLLAGIRHVTARGNSLTIRLSRPDGGFLGNLASAPVCAVPVATPIDPHGINTVPTAGPYYVASYTPNQQLVLRRNPNYNGNRPHRLDEIVYRLGIDPSRGVADVEAGRADYVAGDLPTTDGAALQAKYGPGSPAAKAGHQQYFISPTLGVRWLHMNTSRPLFARVALRKAVNYALDRAAIAAEDRKFFVPNPFNVGDATGDYVPSTMTGAAAFHLYPTAQPELAKARQLAGHVHATATMYAASEPPWPQEAQVIVQDLRQIGIDVQVRTFPLETFFQRIGRRGEAFDLAVSGWTFSTPDPAQALSPQFDGRTISATDNYDFSYFDSASFDAALDAAARLSGALRYRTYGRLAYKLERDYAPVAALATATSRALFSARIGCQLYQPVFGIDLGALCIRP